MSKLISSLFIFLLSITSYAEESILEWKILEGERFSWGSAFRRCGEIGFAWRLPSQDDFQKNKSKTKTTVIEATKSPGFWTSTRDPRGDSVAFVDKKFKPKDRQLELSIACVRSLPASTVPEQNPLPTLQEIQATHSFPLKIQATGQRETLEPKVNGKNHGLAGYYHPNGQLYGVINWVDGKKEGPYLLRREDGTFEQYLSYHEGNPDGIAIWVNADGSIQQVAEYSNGEPKWSRICRTPARFADIQESPAINFAVIKDCGLTGTVDLARPSFDCAVARLPVEKLICGNKDLAKADTELSEAYEEALRFIDAKKFSNKTKYKNTKNTPNKSSDGGAVVSATTSNSTDNSTASDSTSKARAEKNSLLDSQRQWLKERDKCLADKSTNLTSNINCLRDSIKKQTLSLNARAETQRKIRIDEFAKTIADLEPKDRWTSKDGKFVFFDQAARDLYENQDQELDKQVPASASPATDDDLLVMLKQGEKKLTRTCREFIDFREKGFEPEIQNQVQSDFTRNYRQCELLRVLRHGKKPKSSADDNHLLLRNLWRALNEKNHYPNFNPLEMTEGRFGFFQETPQKKNEDGWSKNSYTVIVKGDFNEDGQEDLLVEIETAMKGASRVYTQIGYTVYSKNTSQTELNQISEWCGVEAPCFTN